MTRILLFALQNLSGSVIVRVLDDVPLSKEYEPSGASLRIFGDLPLIVIFFKVRLSPLEVLVKHGDPPLHCLSKGKTGN